MNRDQILIHSASAKKVRRLSSFVRLVRRLIDSLTHWLALVLYQSYKTDEHSRTSQHLLVSVGSKQGSGIENQADERSV